MTQTVNIHEAKTRLSALLTQVEQGEEVVICRANQPIARLEPYHPEPQPRQLGEAKGKFEMAPDFDELPEEFIEHFS